PPPSPAPPPLPTRRSSDLRLEPPGGGHLRSLQEHRGWRSPPPPPDEPVQRQPPARPRGLQRGRAGGRGVSRSPALPRNPPLRRRSEEHTSELQSRFDLVCR